MRRKVQFRQSTGGMRPPWTNLSMNSRSRLPATTNGSWRSCRYWRSTLACLATASSSASRSRWSSSLSGEPATRADREVPPRGWMRVRGDASEVALPANTPGSHYLAAYRKWMELNRTTEARTRTRRESPAATLDLRGPVELVVLSVKQKAARCRLLGSDQSVTLRAGRL